MAPEMLSRQVKQRYLISGIAGFGTSGFKLALELHSKDGIITTQGCFNLPIQQSFLVIDFSKWIFTLKTSVIKHVEDYESLSVGSL